MGLLELVLPHWWAELGSRISGCSVQSVLKQKKTVLIIILASIYQLLSTSQHASKILQA